MSNRRSRRDDDDRDDDEIIRDDATQAAANAFKRGADALSNAEIGKTKKFLGIISMDAGIVDAFDGFYNMGADLLSHSIRPKILGLVQKHGARIPGVNAEKAKTLGVAAAIGSTVLMKTGGYFGAIWDGLSSQVKARRELARTISPVLDDIKGNHSLAALYTTSERDNEVIYAQRQRLGKMASSKNVTNLTNLAVSSGTSLAFDAGTIFHVWSKRATITQKNYEELMALRPKKASAEANGQDALQTFKLGAMGMLPQISKRIAATNEYNLQKEMQSYSALEMIVELSEQVSSNPKATGFTVPRSFQKPHGRREQYPLEEYLMRICIQHQKDMSYIDSKHTEIRQALRDDLAAAVKPLAEAIRKGDFSAIDLIHLVGEGKLIKNQGRAIATAEEVQALVYHGLPKGKTDLQKKPAHDNDDTKEEKHKSSVHTAQYMGKIQGGNARREDVVGDNDNDHAAHEINRRENGHHGHRAP